MRNIKTKNCGFTIIEIIIVIAILIILGTAAFLSLTFFQNKNRVDQTAREIVGTLRLAQNKTLASEGATNYGIHFEAGKFTLFLGTNYVAGNAGNSDHNLPSDLRIYNINLGGASQIVFDRLAGTTVNAGSVTVGLAADSSQDEIIYIDGSGVISLQSGGGDDSNRIKDSRHAHAVYNQNTQSSANLVLDFPNDLVSQTIPFQNYLNAGKTQFSWSGNISVNGVNQRLTIHTHWLTATSTEFCIHRDRRYNSKALRIGLDGQNIVNYAADGTITPGTSVWADAPQNQ